MAFAAASRPHPRRRTSSPSPAREPRAAYGPGFFDDLMTPYLGLTRDQNLRPDTTPEKIASLRTVFGTGDDATMTAGNSTALTDGASPSPRLPGVGRRARTDPARLVRRRRDRRRRLRLRRRGAAHAPAYAVPRMLARNGLSLQDFDVYEIHEAFAATVLTTLAAWEDETFCRERLGLDAPLGPIDRSRLNPNGSSLAAGHPFAATGGRILAGLAKELHAKGKGSRGLVSVCAAGGQGVVAILEAA